MLAAAGIAVCVGAVVVVWVAGALYNALHTLHNASHAPRESGPEPARVDTAHRRGSRVRGPGDCQPQPL
jgi:hypothetical protein